MKQIIAGLFGTFLLFGATEASAQKIGCAEPEASYEVRTINLDGTEQPLKGEVISAIKEQIKKYPGGLVSDFTKINFASRIGGALRNAMQVESTLKAMSFPGLVPLTISAIKTDADANILSEDRLWSGQAKFVGKAKFATPLARDHNFRLTLPTDTVEDYKVVFPLKAKATGMPEARTFWWNWNEKNRDCTMYYYVVLTKDPEIIKELQL